MKILCVFGAHNYGQRARGQSYEHANFLPGLRGLGHDVVFFESWDRDAYADFAELNRRLLTAVADARPDLVFLVMFTYEIWIETLTLIRASGATVLTWGADDSWKYSQFARFIAPECDVYVTTYAAACKRAQREGMGNFELSQWAADAAALREPLPAAQCRYAVSFVGSAYGNRPRWIAALRRRGIDVDCFGHGWPNGPLDTEEVARVMRESVISLNFGDSGVHWTGLLPARNRQIKARIFEVPGAGGFLLTESAPGIEEYFELDRELVCFQGLDDLAQKVRRYLADPAARDVIARASHQRIAREHTYEQRFARILGRIPQRRADAPIGWPAFERAAARHRTGWALRGLRRALLWPMVMIWGPQRGRRAARRLLYELSWRLAGATTYSAAGLPGRVFYF